jgi:hypothetical protein
VSQNHNFLSHSFGKNVHNIDPCFRDTFARFDGWRKGVLFVNGFNVGRYWPTEGPQQTLYIPATLLYGRGKPNHVVVFEQEPI